MVLEITGNVGNTTRAMVVGIEYPLLFFSRCAAAPTQSNGKYDIEVETPYYYFSRCAASNTLTNIITQKKWKYQIFTIFSGTSSYEKTNPNFFAAARRNSKSSKTHVFSLISVLHFG